jgi:HrpA-like RNA helicase
MLSENRLPVLDFGDVIVKAVQGNPVTIIVAETGAGKSTQVPQLLHDKMGGASVIVTQPRRLAARTLAARVASERNSALGGLVGYKTAFEQQFSAQTKICFCTDGLEVVRELSDARRPEVLIVDEVHEWNCNVEVLLAWAKKELAAGMKTKVVIMSATLDAERLAEFFGGAPVINVPGRLFPVEEVEPKLDMVTGIFGLAKEGRNVLVFLPGKSEIGEMIKDLKAFPDLNAEIVPLHGELSPEEQDKAFRRYSRPKIVCSTNVAQTSVTIDDIDAVVDSGVVKQVETHDGVEGLYERRISKADASQRKGRAGRCKPGLYMYCYDGGEEEAEFPTPEIQRVRLDQLVLRLAIHGINAMELQFFHQPSGWSIRDAWDALRLLGAIGSGKRVTQIGKEMAKLPISVEYARILVEGQRLERENDKLNLLDDLIVIVALLEVGGITEKDKKEFGVVVPAAWRSLTKETKSDLIAQLEVFRAGLGMPNSEARRQNGIHARRFYRAKEIVQELARRIYGEKPDRGNRVRCTINEQRELLMKSIVTGFLGAVYKRHGTMGDYSRKVQASSMSSIAQLRQAVVYGVFRKEMDDRRIGHLNSVIPSSYKGVPPALVIGVPFDLSLANGREMALLVMVSEVTPELLESVAPHLMTSEIRFDWLTKNQVSGGGEMWVVRMKRIKQFNGTEVLCEHINVSYAEAMQMLSEDERARLQESMKRELQYQAEAEERRRAQPIPSWGQPSWALPAYAPPPPPPSPKSLIPQSDRATGEWTHREKRDWLCPNGHTVRAPKDKTQKMECDICGAERDNSVPPEAQ